MLDELPQWKERWDILPGVPEEVRRLASDQPYVQVPVWKGFHEVGIGSGEEGAGGCPECVNNRARSRWKQRSPREWRKVTRNERNAKELQTAKTERLYPTVVDAGEQGYHTHQCRVPYRYLVDYHWSDVGIHTEGRNGSRMQECYWTECNLSRGSWGPTRNILSFCCGFAVGVW